MVKEISLHISVQFMVLWDKLFEIFFGQLWGVIKGNYRGNWGKIRVIKGNKVDQTNFINEKIFLAPFMDLNYLNSNLMTPLIALNYVIITLQESNI